MAQPAPQPIGLRRAFDAVTANIERVIRGKRDAIHLAVICLFAEGHLLIEDVPGVGKTSLAKAIARSIGASWQRIQFTPDLLPSDVTGVSIWNRAANQFEFRPGGVFANIVLADEVNRASPKTQSALLEAMEERQVTVDANTYELVRPFMVIATQNPVELEGTYPLPEAQLDRFLLRLRIGYPEPSAELEILSQHGARADLDRLEPVLDADDLAAAADQVGAIHVSDAVRRYIVDIVAASRNHADLTLGVSPRGALGLQRCAQTLAAAIGRDYVIPDDAKHLAPAVLGHRVMLSAEAQLRGLDPDDVVRAVVASVPVPGATGD
jgi:MoxR-like ATPase